MNKSIVIYKNQKFYNIFNLNNFIQYYGDILDIYFIKEYNPPFFKTLIYEDPESKEFVRKAWNITLINGILIIPLKYSKYLNEFLDYDKIGTILNVKYAIYKKKTPFIYTFYNKYRIVDFMIIGVEKAGTTSCMENLSEHPDIYLAKDENHPGGELHYTDMHIFKGIDWYKNKFDYSYRCVGDKNPNLIYLDYTYPIIQKMNPCIKSILFLRNPIDRAYSAWNMFNVRNKTYIKNENRKTFEQVINEELTLRVNESKSAHVSYSHYLQKGLYYKQIKKYLKFFPIQNLCIIITEDLINDEIKTYNKIYDFLNVGRIHHKYNTKLKGIYTQKEKNDDITPILRKKMVDFLKDDVKQLESFLNIKTNWM